jgi:hypothetical protein
MIPHQQTPAGMLPTYGRFIGNVLETEAGVWRIRMNRSKLVAALQRGDSRTWFEVLDYSAGNDGSHVTTVGDGDDEDEFEDDEEDSGDEMHAALMHRQQELAQ